MRYVILFMDGRTAISETEPLADDETISRMLPVENFTEAVAIESMVWQAFALGDRLATSPTTKLIAEIDEYKSTNKRLVETIDRLREKSTNLGNCVSGLRRVISRIITQLALQNVLQNTHSDRNRENGEIIRDAHYWLNKPVDEFTDNTPSGMDDIPF